MLKLLKKIKCKVFFCLGSKCTLNDTDQNGIPDQLTIENLEEHDKQYKLVVGV